jgi:hypothetical protein
MCCERLWNMGRMRLASYTMPPSLSRLRPFSNIVKTTSLDEMRQPPRDLAPSPHSVSSRAFPNPDGVNQPIEFIPLDDGQQVIEARSPNGSTFLSSQDGRHWCMDVTTVSRLRPDLRERPTI